jgi:hypothetical protein
VDGPSEDFRGNVAIRADAFESEEELESLLGEVAEEILRDLDSGESAEAQDTLAAVISWTTVVSDTVARFSAPASPWKRRVSGWSKAVLDRMQQIAQMLLGSLTAAARALGASSWSIGIGFPWGVSVSLTWP